MKSLKFSAITFFVLYAISVPDVFANVSGGLLMGYSRSMTSRKVKAVIVDTQSEFSSNFGFLAAYEFAPTFSMETNLIFKSLKFSVPSSVTGVTPATSSFEVYKLVQLPLFIQLQVIPGLKLGVGGYATLHYGSIVQGTKSVATVAATSTTTSASEEITEVYHDTDYTTAQIAKLGYGLAFQVRYTYFPTTQAGLFAEARYNRGSKNQDDSGVLTSEFTLGSLDTLAGIELKF